MSLLPDLSFSHAAPGFAVACLLMAGCLNTEPELPDPKVPIPVPDQSRCGSASPDAVVNDLGATVPSSDGSYGQAACPGSFVVVNEGIMNADWKTTASAFSSFAGIRDEASCRRAFLYVSVWREEAAGYTLEYETSMRAAWGYSSVRATKKDCLASAGTRQLEVPPQLPTGQTRHRYKVVAGAADDDGRRYPVFIKFTSNWYEGCPEFLGSCSYESPACGPVTGILGCQQGVPGGSCFTTLCGPCSPDGKRPAEPRRPANSGTCGACAGRPCTGDDRCAPGLHCVDGICVDDPTCDVPPDLCYEVYKQDVAASARAALCQ